jgi:hypothetical protein
MKLTLEAFKQLCRDEGFGLTLPEADQERLHAALDKKLGWSKGERTDGFIAAYAEAWEYRYKTKPIVDGKAAGIAKRLVTDLGAQVAIELVEAYLDMSDAYYIQRRHDLQTFSFNLNQVKIYAERGETISRTELNQTDRRQANAKAFGPLLGGKR